MVTQVQPILCPKCKQSVLGIDRGYGGRRDLTEVQIFHHDVKIPNCIFKMSWKDAQNLANLISRDIGGRK